MEPGASYMIRQNFTSSIDVMLVNILNKFYSDLMLIHRNCSRGRNLTCLSKLSPSHSSLLDEYNQQYEHKFCFGVDMMNEAHTYPIKHHVTLFSVNFQIGKQLCMKCPCQASKRSKRKVVANADIMSQVD